MSKDKIVMRNKLNNFDSMLFQAQILIQQSVYLMTITKENLVWLIEGVFFSNMADLFFVFCGTSFAKIIENIINSN